MAIGRRTARTPVVDGRWLLVGAAVGAIVTGWLSATYWLFDAMFNDPQAWAMKHMRERVKGIIWLNPEGQWGWGIGDSVMPLYAPHCDVVRECRTIGQLAQVVDNLVHHWWRRGR